MEILFVLLVLLSFFAAILGLINPKIVLMGKLSRFKTFMLFIGIMILSFIGLGITSTSKYSGKVTTQTEQKKLTFEEAKAKVAKKADDEKEAKLREAAEKISADDFKGNFDIYSELAKLNPKNEFYQKEYDRYKNLMLEESKAKDAAEKKAAAEKEAKLFEEAKKIPADNFKANFDAYSELIKLNSENELYQKKYDQYRTKAELIMTYTFDPKPNVKIEGNSIHPPSANVILKANKLPLVETSGKRRSYNKYRWKDYPLGALTFHLDRPHKLAKITIGEFPEIVPKRIYRGNTLSKVFHRRRCRYYNCAECTATFKTREEAINAGYKPCGVCKP